MSSSEGIVGDEAPPPQRQARVRRDGPTAGPLCIFVVVACTGGFWNEYNEGQVPESWSGCLEGLGMIVGVVCGPVWSLAESGSAAESESQAELRSRSVRMTRGFPFGYVEYPIRAWARLREPVDMLPGTARQILDQLAGLAVVTSEDSPDEVTVGGIVEKWTASGVGAVRHLARLAPHVALQVLSGTWACLHCVAVTRKTNRQRFLDTTQPSRQRLAAFLAKAAENRPSGTGAAISTSERRLANAGWLGCMHDAALVLDWLDASRFVRNIRKSREAAHSFGRIFARSSGINLAHLVRELKEVHPETLRRARVRLDCVAMILFRRLWRATVSGASADELPNIYLFADASPQWRQLELYASSFDLQIGDSITHRLFPAIALDKEFMSAAGKAVALLWQIFLLAGPSYFLVRLFCSRVRSVTTDQGVERLLADFPQFLPDFYWMVDAAYQVRDTEACDRLFPRALAMPGWQHLWDLLMRKGLSGVRFFPQWLVGLKAIVSFLRSTAHSTAIARSLRAKGLDGAADLVEFARLPNFAEWRWGTLLLCCNRLAGFLDTLIANFDVALFKQTRDRTSISAMLLALQSPLWRKQFNFVHWFCDWLGGIMAWGRGCDCHEEALRAGADIECPKKGRRLKQAYGHAMSELRCGLEAANGWTIATWDFGSDTFFDCQACVRATFHLALRKLDFLDKVPYLLARLAEPGVRDRCIAQWEACAPEHHHRVTHEFLALGSPLRSMVDGMRGDGTGIAPPLQREVDSLGYIPMDDSVAESPHASAARHMRHARGAKWPWVASTMRLEQNLADARDIPPATGADLNNLWASYKSVLRGPSVKPGRRDPTRGKGAKKFHADLYHLAFALEPMAEQPLDLGAGGGDNEGGNDDGGEHGGGLGGMLGRLRGRKRGPPNEEPSDRPAGVAGSSGPPGNTTSGSAAAQRDVGHPRMQRRNTDEAKLLRQFFAACLAESCFVSIQVADDEGEPANRFFQVLAAETKPILVKTFADAGDDKEHGLFTVTVQPYERWAGSVAHGSGDQAVQQVFIVQDPCLLDILLLAGGLENRHTWMKWTPGESDLEGCIAMSSPKPWATTLPLSSPRILVLCLLDALHGEGWAGRPEKVTHESVRWKNFDERNILSQRFYLQCLVALPALFPLVGAFPSGELGAFYALLLKCKQAVTPGQGAKAYNRALAEADGDLVEIAALSCDAHVALPKPGGRALSAIADDAGSIFGDDTGEEDADIAAPERPANNLDSDDVVGDDGGKAVSTHAPADTSWPQVVLGQAVRQVSGRTGGKWNYHPRLSVMCSNPAHEKCSKSRSTLLDVETHGRLASVYYLGAWLRRQDLPVEEHRKYAPNKEEVRSFADAYSA